TPSASHWAAALCSTRNCSQRLIQIGDQVVGVLQADRDAQQVLGRARRGPLDAGAVLDQAVRATQTGGANEKLALRRHPKRRARMKSWLSPATPSAASRDPSTWTDSMPPNIDICRAATLCPGC